MRIAYIGNFRAVHSTENEVRKALLALGHDVLEVQEDTCPWVDLFHTIPRPDVLLWTHTHGFADESKHADCWLMLDRARALGVPTVAYHLDRWWGLERQRQVETEPFFRCSLVVTADGDPRNPWAEHGINHRWLPPAIGHEEVGRGTFNPRFASDIAFVGGWRGYGHSGVWPWRNKLIHHLQSNWGEQLRLWPEPEQPAIRGAALRDLYASVRVVVGDSCLAGGATHYWSDRLPETIGRGGLLLHPDVEGLDEWWPPVDRTPPRIGLLPWRFDFDLDSVDETIELALALDEAEHDAITEAGIEHVREHHTYVQRMAQVLAWVEEGA